MAEIEKDDFKLNISGYISSAVGEAEIGVGGSIPHPACCHLPPPPRKGAGARRGFRFAFH